MKIDDGYSTTISFAINPHVRIWEKQVTPPGMDGGGANDTTTMRNNNWRTMAHKNLKTLSNMTYTGAYDPHVNVELLAMLNHNQLITVTYADGSTLAFYGWIDKFTPGAVVEGKQPECTVEVIPSNQNSVGVETSPVFTWADSSGAPYPVPVTHDA